MRYNAEYGNRAKHLFKNAAPAELSKNDLEKINMILNHALENYNKNTKAQFEKDIVLSNYKCQHVPVINEIEEKEVYINCFNNKDKDIEKRGYWKTDLVIVFDGGNNYFQVKINLTKEIYYDFHANGYA